MAGLTKSDFANPVINWIDTRLPIFTMMQKEYGVFPTPKNFNYFWNFGALAMVALVIMIITGIFLAMDYQPNSELAFGAIQHIMRDVNYGWLIRYVHQNGASMFFIVTYIHIFRGMYYGSYKTPRELLWMLGVVILLLMMATAFMGYVLPWGQMSYWGATVITNLFSAFPVVGPKIVTLLWGGFSVDNPTLNRFFALHYLLPFVLVGVIFLHIAALHITGSNNPLGIDVKSPQDTLPFHPYYTIKDSVGICVFLIVWAAMVFFAPNYPGRREQLHPGQPAANARGHRAGMVLPAVLRDPALCAEQAAGRMHDVRLVAGAVRAAVAGYVAGAQCSVPADLPADYLGLGGRGDRSGRLRRPQAGRHLGHPEPGVHLILFPALPGDPAGARQIGAAVAAAGEHQPAGSRRTWRRPLAWRRPGQADGESVMRALRFALAGALAAGLLAAPAGHAGGGAGKDAERELELRSSVRHLRSRRRTARVPGLFQCLLQLPFDAVSALPGSVGHRPGRRADQGDRRRHHGAVGLDDQGNPKEGPATPASQFKSPFANEKAARSANNGALPPDLSLIVNAREGGPNYVYGILTGFAEAPSGFKMQDGMYYNKMFPGHQIGMPQPLQDGTVEYTDGTPNTLPQEAHDVVTFLSWAANPETVERKQIGVRVILFLVFMTGLTYAVKRKVWSDVHH